eukprot:CAMPEP_0174309278 /NCGR_PEP_ID=MMETSP0810-20121108/2303_1 /TAXON_ID=73025 ORGANISM="Eutreptiella gymnastica-like, Strain CCMP1594" /NCGR_SAMPLE_ID=MMETSP0810 /ASSEMBLY_ACC=CAM_ASM_000659 /LENGTH=118 /DNA_ID=CAMNT_0015416857 /DNA_START=1 /DNA_END=353 /DNA_ORIENTATION=-
MMSEFGKDPNADMMDGTRARGTKSKDPGSGRSRRRDDDAQMMSEFGRDPDADLMDTTRARTRARRKDGQDDDADMMSDFSDDPNADAMGTTRAGGADGPRSPGSRRRGDDAEMMSEFG